MTSVKALFDNHALDYDEKFTESWLGRYYRIRTHNVFYRFIKQPKRILELNAGTGEDALYLARRGNAVVATDISNSMLQVIKKKVKQENLNHLISVKLLDIEELREHEQGEFGVVVSNFGGLNCTKEWKKFAKSCNSVVEKEGIVIVCIMGPKVPWEWLWFSFRGEFRKAFRRLKGYCEWNGATIYYPKPKKIRHEMSRAAFNLIYQEGLGMLMPPPYTKLKASRWKRMLSILERLEQGICRTAWACNYSDHYLLVFQKESNNLNDNKF